MIWRLSQCTWQPPISSEEYGEEEIIFLLAFHDTTGLSGYQNILPFWIMWKIWRSRCNYILKKQSINQKLHVQWAHGDVKSWLQATTPSLETKLPDTQTKQIRQHWK